MTPDELAKELATTGKRVRDVLRAEYPRSPAERYQRWILDANQAARVRQVLREGRSIGAP